MNTTITLPWLLLICVVAGTVLAGIQEWFTGQYEVARRGFRFSVTRRWYGVRAHVCLRAYEDDDPERYTVLRWDAEITDVPWLLAQNLDDEESRSFWAPVTEFAPYTVRRIRPHILRTERYRFPQLFDYRPLRQPAGYLRTDA